MDVLSRAYSPVRLCVGHELLSGDGALFLPHSRRHSRAGGNLASAEQVASSVTKPQHRACWIPAFAGMTPWKGWCGGDCDLEVGPPLLPRERIADCESRTRLLR